MSVSDPVADFLTTIRNGIRAKHRKVDVPASRLKTEIARVLLGAGYLSNYKVIEDQKQGVLRVYLKYSGNERNVITGIKRVSTPGRRVYVNKLRLPSVMGGLGVSVLSTSRGVMTEREAREAGLGGELLCQVW